MAASRQLAALFSALVTLAVAGHSFANGSQCHVWITTEALKQGSLYDWARDPKLRKAWLNGSVFPDGGYVVQHEYGETAHWEPFLTAYIKALRAHPGKLGTPEAKAFALGIASHGMADQVFDATFMKKAKVKDAKGWSDGQLTSLDSKTDVMLAAQAGPVPNEQPWWPTAAVEMAYEDLGLEVSQTTIDSGQDSMLKVVLQFGRLAANSKESVKAADDQYPWASKHLLDPREPGSLPCEAFFVARYLDAVQRRIELKSTWLELLGSIPPSGARHHPVSAQRVDSQVILVFSHGIERAKVASDAFEVHDHQGKKLPVDVHWWSSHGNLVRIVPKQDWPTEGPITVSVRGLTSIDGVSMIGQDSVSFMAKDVPDGEREIACHRPERLGMTELAKDGGCGMGPARMPNAMWLGFVVVAIVALRRRRGGPARSQSGPGCP